MSIKEYLETVVLPEIDRRIAAAPPPDFSKPPRRKSNTPTEVRLARIRKAMEERAKEQP